MSAKDKFTQLMELLADKGTTESEEEPTPVMKKSGLAGVLKKKKEAIADQFKADPSLYGKMSTANASSMVLMPPADIEDWQVQVVPEGGNMLHFQAVSKPGTQYYVRWYSEVASDIYEAVALAHSSASFSQLRPSMYGTAGKYYLACKRVSEEDVDIPGYGLFHIPELFSSSVPAPPKSDEEPF